jgi:ribosomal peptide maturation radical SAM protein 1
MSDVLLVQPPFAPLERPSMGLSVLKAGLTEKGISSRVLYPCFDLAEQIGIETYGIPLTIPLQALVGEWVFAKAAFPEHQPDEEQYYVMLRSQWPELPSQLASLREYASVFSESIAQAIVAQKPRIVGCSSVFAQHCASLSILRFVKSLDSSIITVLGGSNCESCMGNVTQRLCPWVDYVVSGEADFCFPALCKSLLEGSKPLPNSAISAVGDDHKLGRAQVLELDKTPIPDFSDYFETLARSPLNSRIRPALMVETSRGCWWGAKHHCTFCGLNGQGMNFRSKSAERVIDELETLSETYSLTNFEAVDNILDMNYLTSVFPHLGEREKRYSIFYETKVNLRYDQLQCMKKAGVRSLQPGIESLDDRVLSLMDKGTTALQNIQLLKWARELGIYIVWNVLYGFPGEEDDWYAQTAQKMDRLVHLQAPARIVRVRYDRYSPYQSQPEKYGVKMRPSRFYPFVYPLDDEEIEELAYFFEDAPGSARGASGPGVELMRQSVIDWADSYLKGPAILSMEPEDDALVLVDTRPVAHQMVHRLEGAAKTLYLACEKARTKRGLYNLGIAPIEVDTLLADLDRKALIYQENDRVLALAVRGELPTLNIENSGLGRILAEV